MWNTTKVVYEGIHCLRSTYKQKEDEKHWHNFHFNKLEKEKQSKPKKSTKDDIIINEIENKHKIEKVNKVKVFL